MGCKAYKTRLAYNVTIRISAQNNFIPLLKHFVTKVLEFKLGLNRRIKFVCVAMCSLVMNLCSRDLHVTSLNNILNSSRLTLHSAWFLDGKTSTCYLMAFFLVVIIVLLLLLCMCYY